MQHQMATHLYPACPALTRNHKVNRFPIGNAKHFGRFNLLCFQNRTNNRHPQAACAVIARSPGLALRSSLPDLQQGAAVVRSPPGARKRRPRPLFRSVLRFFITADKPVVTTRSAKSADNLGNVGWKGLGRLTIADRVIPGHAGQNPHYGPQKLCLPGRRGPYAAVSGRKALEIAGRVDN